MARSAGRSPTSKHRGREIGRQTPYLVMVKATTNGGEQLASSSRSQQFRQLGNARHAPRFVHREHLRSVGIGSVLACIDISENLASRVLHDVAARYFSGSRRREAARQLCGEHDQLALGPPKLGGSVAHDGPPAQNHALPVGPSVSSGPPGLNGQWPCLAL